MRVRLRVRHWAVGLVAMAALSACSSATDGQGSVQASGSGASSGAPSPDFPSASSSQTPSSPPSDGSKEVTESAAPIRDFTKVSFKIPSGFVRSDQYSQVISLENISTNYYFVPKAAYNGRDLLTVILHTLPSDVVVNSAQQQSDRVDYYNKKLHASLPNGTREATLAGLPAFSENVVQPPDFHYATFFAFGRHHMLQFSCQVGSTRSAADIIANACQSMMASLRVS